MATLKKDDIPVDVTWEDQQRICTFSRVHRHLQHLLKKQKALADDLEKIDDAATEIMVVDDDLMAEDGDVNNADAAAGADAVEDGTISRIKFVFGEAFVDVDAERCGELLNIEKTRLEEEQAGVAAEVHELEAALEELKAQLYAKFGSQIYLEDK